MLDGVNVLVHSSIKFSKEKVIYFDPFKIDRAYNDADIIFITHDHYDHYSEDDINMVRKDGTVIVVPKSLEKSALKNGFDQSKIVSVNPNEDYEVGGIKFTTVRAYNVDKHFHPKANNWVGYIITIDGIDYYIAGDTDITEDNIKVKCDVAFVPVGGTFTMDYREAARLVNEIKPKVAIPIHYGSIVGTEQDGINFTKLVLPDIECKILIK